MPGCIGALLTDWTRNERYNETNTISTAGWSAHNLTFGERKPFTKAADGWSAEELEVAGFSLDIRCISSCSLHAGVHSKLTFALRTNSRQVAMALEPGWQWVEGELAYDA